MARRINRRHFLQSSAAAASAALLANGVVLGEDTKTTAARRADKLRIGIIGCGGMGGGNHSGVLSEEIVAVCDIDEQRLNGDGARKSPKAKLFTDFRKMLDECGKDLDAVIVSTPDHTHAVASVMAMKLGLHCYCEKPLTHDVYEARVMRQVAAATKAKGGGKLMTQMGNRGTSEPGFRKNVEMLRAGVIGKVSEVHVWTDRPDRFWKQGIAERPATQPVPGHVKWDLWLSTAPERPYAPGYHPFAWRGWWDFGTGALGDMACHTSNMAYMALNLGAPTAVSAESEPVNPETAPRWSTIKYEFPARGELPPVTLYWYDGTKDGKKHLPPPAVLEKIAGSGSRMVNSGLFLIGDKGMLYSPNDYGSQAVLLPKENFADYQAPSPTLPRSPGNNHYREWIEACKGGTPCLSNFDYAGPLTEFVLLGNVAMRVGKRVEWDGENLKSPNCPEAAQYVKREYRKGWSLDASS
jgi:predicted dehydrogenase